MRIVFLLFTLFLWHLSEAQEQPLSTLRLQTGDCRADSISAWPGVSLFTIYKLPEDRLVLQASPRDYNELPVLITNLPVSDYRISYENNFGQPVERYTHTRQDSAVTVTLCPDLLLRYPANTLSKLQDGDTILIKFFSQGCFHLNSFRILIRKKKEQFIAQLIVAKNLLLLPSDIKDSDSPDSVLQTALLSPQQMRDFKRFENELSLVKGAGCTTTERYELTSKYSNVLVKDEGCRWKGFYYLRKSLFSEKEVE